MADVTGVFKATVKTVKSRNKAFGDGGGEHQSSILGRKKNTEGFENKAKNLVKTIAKLRESLLQCRKAYINAGSPVLSDSPEMTDAERDKIDMEAQLAIKLCQDTIGNLRREPSSLLQTKEHRHAVISILEDFLKSVCKIYSEQRAVRVKRVVDRKRISRLEPDKQSTHVAKLEQRKEAAMLRPQDAEASEEKEPPRGAEKHRERKSDLEKKAPPPSSPQAALEPPPSLPGEEISEEEAQMFELENKALFEEMNSMSEEVKQIEGKVVEIAKLQEIFTEKVLEQDKDVTRISNLTVGSSENIKDGNEEVRQAMKNKADVRVWTLFIILVSSFSLLFLDWYNP